MATEKEPAAEVQRTRFRKALEELVSREMNLDDSDWDVVMSELVIEAAQVARTIDPLGYPAHAYQAQVLWVINQPSQEDIEQAAAEAETDPASEPPGQHVLCAECMKNAN